MHPLERVSLKRSEKGEKGGFVGFTVKKGVCKGLLKIKQVGSDIVHMNAKIVLY